MTVAKIRSATVVLNLADGSTWTYEFHEGSDITGTLAELGEQDWNPRAWPEDLTRVPWTTTHHLRLDLVAGPGAHEDGTMVTMSRTDTATRAPLPFDGTPSRQSAQPKTPTELHLDDPRDTLKMLRETLCAAQSALLRSDTGRQAANLHSDRLERIIAEIDRQRPLGADGKHGDRHTPTCGCRPTPSSL